MVEFFLITTISAILICTVFLSCSQCSRIVWTCLDRMVKKCVTPLLNPYVLCTIRTLLKHDGRWRFHVWFSRTTSRHHSHILFVRYFDWHYRGAISLRRLPRVVRRDEIDLISFFPLSVVHTVRVVNNKLHRTITK